MYNSFFGLCRSPFENTPNPAFTYPTARYEESLAALYYVVKRRKGIGVVTGESGTGKTLVIRSLLELLNRNQVAYAYVFNGRLSAHEFLQYIARDFGLPVSGKSKGELIFDLGNYLVTRHQKNLTTVLVVDEAHQLPIELLEELNLLTNLETAQEKLLQILLVGQPKLDRSLDSSDLLQLKQRIAIRAQLRPFEERETTEYIRHRIRVAGGDPIASTLFSDTITRVIHMHSRGIPRLINTICENALITCYARQVTTVAEETIEEVVSDLHLDIVQPEPASVSTRQMDAWEIAKALFELVEYVQNVCARESHHTLARISRP
jgi:general secretion pathway protein A